MRTVVSDEERAARESALRQLPLVTLYLSERCNSRCITCDYWRHGVADMGLDSVARLLPSLARLQTQVALISGGEPLLNPEWPQIAELLRRQGLKLWLLTSGLSLAKHARRATELFEAITVSLDGTDRATYAAIRGLDAFEKVCEGIRAVAQTGCAGERARHAAARQLPAVAAIRRAGARSSAPRRCLFSRSTSPTRTRSRVRTISRAGSGAAAAGPAGARADPGRSGA